MRLFSTLLFTTLFASAVAVQAATPKVKVLVLDPTGKKFSEDDRSTFAGLIASALARRPLFDVATMSDVRKSLALDAARQMAGCNDSTCLADIAGTMGARLVVFGDVNRLGKLLVFNLNLFDSAETKSVGRSSVQAESIDLLPSRIRQGMDELLAAVIAERRLVRRGKARCPAGMAMIPGGQFFMGADEGNAKGLKNAQPSFHVTLAPFCIDLHEVTTARYRACSSAGKCRRASKTVSWPKLSEEKKALYSPLCNSGRKDRDDHPINCIPWKMAKRFCQAQGGRLPTEAEWEYATRGPDGRLYPWGDDVPTANDLNACGSECTAWGKKNGVSLKALYDADDGFAITAPVGTFPAGASRFGPFDVAGNVWEWVADWYGPYTDDDQKGPKGPSSGKKRVVRGGAFNGADKSWVRPAYRFSALPAQRSHAIGFRCAAPVNDTAP